MTRQKQWKCKSDTDFYGTKTEWFTYGHVFLCKTNEGTTLETNSIFETLENSDKNIKSLFEKLKKHLEESLADINEIIKSKNYPMIKSKNDNA